MRRGIFYLTEQDYEVKIASVLLKRMGAEVLARSLLTSEKITYWDRRLGRIIPDLENREIRFTLPYPDEVEDNNPFRELRLPAVNILRTVSST